ncbi:imm11 family protein [Xanthomonas hortorum]|uniref:DUF1629 domain-containing protein n=2 Tax=Xanthomonas hortorum pv. pelargonii TaxID=453602 RepID=A0AAX0A3W7_9XANT|nr:DUF1629 domain-containing protein [Xanthomonas hortorum]MCE4356587.1 DUF1629 domain-containing protein [Xanthomonas hortorum pv. pelargonii]MCM5526507.1 DUF1629 domain-containing protein [Xanthomonas hortorum pv. pelargonii]MCM5538526.1 DUF1629 domain-containing protein [Xanthomonas hortorum pv. pelargonii]MCM5540653.1 DUF1629 domain-containing protein [Xanthomonas hortorum pv. pelargonii]MCM5546810.1 DUF1629 domain-containing protein [Xanthomonas hortorum pv. pelargonii]
MEVAMNQTAIPVTIPSVTHKGKFFVLRPSFWGNGQSSGLEIANKKRLRLPGTFMIEPPNGDPNQYPEKPHLIHVPELGGMPRDFEKLAGQWIVSEALKHVFEAVDPQGLAFSACDFTLADGSPGPQYYFCGVLRSLDALDEAESRVKIEYERDHQTGEDLKFYSVAGGASLVFKQEVVGNGHIFRQPRLGIDAICDRTLADALEAANLDGIQVRDAAEF